MARKEKIIEILDKYWIHRGWIESDESMVEARPLTAKEELADAIMALPIEVPSEEEISHILDKIQDLSSREREEFYDVITGTINWIKENNIIKDEDNPNLSETLLCL